MRSVFSTSKELRRKIFLIIRSTMEFRIETRAHAFVIALEPRGGALWECLLVIVGQR